VREPVIPPIRYPVESVHRIQQQDNKNAGVDVPTRFKIAKRLPARCMLHLAAGNRNVY